MKHAPPPQQRKAAAAQSPPPDLCTPADRYQDLFVAVQSQRIFSDSKTFVDCIPLRPPEEIMQAWQAARHRPGFDLRAFVAQHFGPPEPAHQGFVPQPGWTMAQHIDALWTFLRREPREHPLCASLLQLPHPYVVPGGRFDELYYWDSYFTMLGLAESGLADLVHSMTDNFAYLIDTYGHVPDGTRTYYLSRSQAPVFALMTQLCETRGGPEAGGYLPQLRREHAFWMDGELHVQPGQSHRRVVMLQDGCILNRYWDDRDTPREESWREDVATAARSGREPHEVYRHLRAAAESGWDFSTRWLAEDAQGRPGVDLATIQTADLVPVDLNGFLHVLETTIAKLAAQTRQPELAQDFEGRARRRAEALHRCCWNEAGGFFVDFDWRRNRQRNSLTAATAVPLFCGIAEPAQARRLAQVLQDRLLAPGGLDTTECRSPEQWDLPNGWAPLQWMAVEGLRRYDQQGLADEIRKRWMQTVQAVFGREHRLLEKYALFEAQAAAAGGGGEYPVQDGFGWTNGVVRRWLDQAGKAA